MAPTVLIVDDEKHTREGLRQALEDQYDVYLAQDADEAFNLLDAESFDVVITDLRMPGKSGVEFVVSQQWQPLPLKANAVPAKYMQPKTKHIFLSCQTTN